MHAARSQGEVGFDIDLAQDWLTRAFNLAQPLEPEHLGIDRSRFEGQAERMPDGTMVVDGALLDENGNKIGKIHRVTDLAKGTMEFKLFEVAADQQGKGISSQVLASGIDYCTRHGIHTVGIFANIDRGAYAWAKYGLVPRTDEWVVAGQLRDQISKRLEGFRAQGVVSDGAYANIREHLQSNDPKALWDIVDDQTEVPGGLADDRRETTTLGKALLYTMSWDGNLKLDDPQAVERFTKYVGRRATASP